MEASLWMDADVSISFALCKPWGKFVQYMVCCTKTTCFFMVQSSVTMLRTTVHTYPAALCSDTGEVINILVRMSIIINLRSFTRCKDRMLSGGSISRICGREPVVQKKRLGELVIKQLAERLWIMAGKIDRNRQSRINFF